MPVTTHEFERVQVGAESRCAMCVFGRMVQTKSVPHPENVLEWRDEHPEADLDDAPFVTLVEHNSHCTNPVLAGSDGRGARSVGTVLDCEEFRPRPLR